MRLTEQEYEDIRRRDLKKIVERAPEVVVEWARDSAAAKPKKPNPRGQHRPGEMNKSETAFAFALDLRRKAGEVKGWKFEAIKLKLADNTYFIPDFNVEMTNGDLVMVEVKRLWKGKSAPHWEDDARVKIKIAAEMFRGWFQFYGAHWDGSQWIYEEF
jgi:hypothetical protein